MTSSRSWTCHLLLVAAWVLCLLIAPPSRAEVWLPGDIFKDSLDHGNVCKWVVQSPAQCGIDQDAFVPAGDFTMGSPDFFGDEAPAHTVYLDPYWIDRNEVTMAAYDVCRTSGPCTPPKFDYNDEPLCNWASGRFITNPINCVDWNQATVFCAWKGKRLPTEAEWEKAARGTDARTFPWGEFAASCSFAVMDDANAGGAGCGLNTTAPVGSKFKGVSPYKIYDMSGNVWEWVNDRYQSWYYEVSPPSNPPGPDTGSSRVIRGASWGNTYLHSTIRSANDPLGANPGLGFRCARSD